MATYKGIKGVKVVTKASDPTASEAAGTVWYNSTSPSALKYSIAGAGAWASGNDMNTARAHMAVSVMAPTSTSLAAAGNAPPGYQNATELYDGTSWATSPATVNTARRGAGGIGTVNTACIIAGGNTPPATDICESFNGSTWTEVNNLTTARKGLQPGGAGSSTAGLLSGGASGPGTVQKVSESWDGTSWSEENDMVTARESGAQFGTSTASIWAGGYTTTYVTTVESWNGTSWTAVNSLNTARAWYAGTGITTGGLVFGGDAPPFVAITESYDGSSWTEVGDLGTARHSQGGTGGSNTSAISFGGVAATATTEVWSDPTYTIKTVTVS